MKKPTFAFYAVHGSDGLPRVAHMIVGTQPEDAVEITEAHAQVISADVRAREPQVEAAPAAQADLSQYITREEAVAMATAAAAEAVSRFAVEIAKTAGGGNADKR